MNINDSQPAIGKKQCCTDFCTKTFNTPNGEIVNAYKCSRKEFSASDIWNIQKQRRQFTVGATIVVSG